MATSKKTAKKSDNVGIKATKLQNSMKQLVSGIVPYSQQRANSKSPNKINSIDVLRAQVRGDYITLDYSLLSFLYQQFGYIQSLIEVPVLDAFRGGVEIHGYEKKVVPVVQKKKKPFFRFWNADGEGNDEKKDFDIEQQKRREQWEKEQVSKDEKLKKSDDSEFRQEISREETRKMEIFIREIGLWQSVQQALFWKRLFGGAGIVILDGRDPSTELRLEDINEDTDLEFFVTDNWELSGNTDFQSNPQLNNVDWLSPVPFTVRGHPVHRSRVVLFKGKEFTPLYRSIGRGWGMSILEPLVRTLNKGVKNENVIFELLDEAKMDIFNFYGLNDAMQDEQATEAVTKRVAYASMVKNYMKAILMDADDEYQQKQIHFSGLADLKIDSRVDMAADARITMNKLYGTSPAGFNSGEADRETYADTVEAEIRIPSEGAMVKLLRVVGRKVLGKTLDFEIEWKPLIRVSEYDVEKQKTLQLANLNEANIWGRITNKEWQEAVNKYNLLGIDVSYKETFVADPMAKQVFKPGFGGK